jgi:hypothetical protein
MVSNMSYCVLPRRGFQGFTTVPGPVHGWRCRAKLAVRGIAAACSVVSSMYQCGFCVLHRRGFEGFTTVPNPVHGWRCRAKLAVHLHLTTMFDCENHVKNMSRNASFCVALQGMRRLYYSAWPSARLALQGQAGSEGQRSSTAVGAVSKRQS